jgi:hypothetical protein
MWDRLRVRRQQEGPHGLGITLRILLGLIGLIVIACIPANRYS